MTMCVDACMTMCVDACMTMCVDACMTVCVDACTSDAMPYGCCAMIANRIQYLGYLCIYHNWRYGQTDELMPEHADPHPHIYMYTYMYHTCRLSFDYMLADCRPHAVKPNAR
jgi:hypothetical protein